MAWGNLWRNRVRTVLAALGILIGVVAIAGLGIAGTALQYGATQQFQGLADRVEITPGPEFVERDTRRPTDGRRPPERVMEDRAGRPVRVGGGGPPVDRRLGPAQIERIALVASNATVVPIKGDRMALSTRTERRDVSVEVVDRPDVLYNVSQGSIPEPFHSGALLHERLAADLGVEVGDLVTVGDRSVRVHALTTSDGFGTRHSEVVLSGPIDRRGYDEVVIVAEDGDAAQALAGQVNATFNADREMLRIQSQSDLGQRTGNFFNVINVILMGIGSISLFVASVSILNVLLMSTIERRGEIGILRAVGVTRFEVLRMILTEATLLGVLGGAAGVVIATALGAILYQVLFEDPTLVFQWRNVRFLVAAFAFGTVASVISGLYPAWRAATADPVEAIRS
ncbi:peptide ABC transporter permease [Halococcoides cellulosivorans]|uniref:Peptide ABC transporter permease n=2 Tax=Halococcoides cellulosivorans TaxID=1679096 RepID=A0A2R4X498_9EURY|nr:peptide ABC transporter permease [Halococcoides cellulosivorans]